MPQDLILPGTSGKRVSAVGAVASGARGIWQFVAWRGNEYGLRHTWWWTNGRIPRKPPARQPAICAIFIRCTATGI